MNLKKDLKEYYNKFQDTGEPSCSKIRTELLILTNSHRDVSITTKKIASRYLEGLGDWTSLSLNYTFDEESFLLDPAKTSTISNTPCLTHSGITVIALSLIHI